VPPSLAFLIFAFTSLLAIINPLSAVPIFTALTATYDPAQRRRTVRTAIVTAFGVLVVFAALGTYILSFFGITTPAFQIAGGIIFFGIGWDMLQARQSRVKTTEEEETAAAEKEDVAIIPLGMPTLAGPGAITTVIALMGQTDDLLPRLMIYAAIVLVLAVCWAALGAAPYVVRRMGPNGLNVLTRIMGLLVMVIGAQFVINGVTAVAAGIA
jgi:multiple antibiotic resistance protein